MGGTIVATRMHWGKKGGKSKADQHEVDDYDKSNALLSDVIMNYKTVISFGQKNVDLINNKYEGLLVEP